MNRRILLYVNQISLSEPSGQAAFERGLIDALRRRLRNDCEHVLLLTVGDPRRTRPTTSCRVDATDRTVEIPLKRRTYLGYLIFQLRLFWAICKELRLYDGEEVAIYVRYNEAMFAPALAALLFNTPLTIRTGPVDINNRNKAQRTLDIWLIDSIFWVSCRIARNLVVVTPTIRNWLERTASSASDKIQVVPNAVDTNKFFPMAPARSRWGLSTGAIVIGYIGAISNDYGIEVVLRAIAKIPKASRQRLEFLVVGDGPNLTRCKGLCEELSLQRLVRWAGKRSPDEIPSAIASCDVMVLPSTAASLSLKGTSAMKLFEYLACDRFVLASRSIETEFLERERIGKLVDPDDSDDWANALCELANLRQFHLGGRAQAVAERDHAFPALAQSVWSIAFSTVPMDNGAL